LLCIPCSWVLLGCFMCSSISISSSSLNIMAYNPTRTSNLSKPLRPASVLAHFIHFCRLASFHFGCHHCSGNKGARIQEFTTKRSLLEWQNTIPESFIEPKHVDTKSMVAAKMREDSWIHHLQKAAITFWLWMGASSLLFAGAHSMDQPLVPPQRNGMEATQPPPPGQICCTMCLTTLFSFW
jgi:hypothetical protein